MASKAETSIVTSLRPVLAGLPNGANIPDSPQLRDALHGLELFLPELLRYLHPEWKSESLDGVLPLVARKIGDSSAEIFGLCLLISDQTTAPIHVRLQLCPSSDDVSWVECKLGEFGEQGMMRSKYQSVSATTERLHALSGKANMINWFYQITYDRRRG
ncbi:MAG: hypothetical protein JWP03_5145 [Phycisphaerales bacterium]|jgi:hypothetical protein|nr:hypothetical protein [Phycisphaerales bacterium]